MEQEQNYIEPVIEAPENFLLDDAAIEMVGDIHRQIDSLNISMQSILSYFARQHKLQGQWQLAPNRKELVKTP